MRIPDCCLGGCGLFGSEWLGGLCLGEHASGDDLRRPAYAYSSAYLPDRVLPVFIFISGFRCIGVWWQMPQRMRSRVLMAEGLRQRLHHAK